MKTLNALKLRIMTRAFKIRIAAGEVFEDIAADYPSPVSYTHLTLPTILLV